MSTTVAIAAWNNLVSTTCDFAEKLVVIETAEGQKISQQEIELCEEPADRRARRIQELDITTLLCGSISRPLATSLEHKGVTVIPYVSGPVNEVLNAYLCGRLTKPRFLQPGCRSGARRRWRHNMRRKARKTGGSKCQEEMEQDQGVKAP